MKSDWWRVTHEDAHKHCGVRAGATADADAAPGGRVRRQVADSAVLDTLRPGLERDTMLMPWLIAESVCGELSAFLDLEIPARYAAWIEARAELCYAKRAHFRKLMQANGNAPRDWDPQRIIQHRHWRWLTEHFPEQANATECQVEAMVYELHGCMRHAG